MTEKLIRIFETSTPDVKRPIARTISLRLAALVTISTIFVGIASYFYSMASIETLAREQLMKYSHERGLRESALFLESDTYQLRFQKEYIERYKRMGDEDPIEWFEEHLEKRPKDGTYRSKPELYYGKDRELGRRDQSASMMVSARTRITPEVRRALAIGYDMVNQYGPAWRKPFVDLYFASPEKTSVSRWPGTPWGLMMDDKDEWRNEEWMAITMKDKNPRREQRWSGVLYDERNGNWMVSGVTPLDIDGKQVGMVGTDLLLDDLVKRTNNEAISGTFNILLQTDGRIIAHPHMVKEIIASKGQLTAQNAVDKHIFRIYERARFATDYPVVIENTKDNEFIAITQIQGPGWYFITVYPKSLLKDKALRNAGFTILSGLASLLIMLFFILYVLKRNLADPLGYLTQALKDLKISRSQWSDRAGYFIKKADELSSNPDETGLLARSFVEMGNNLRDTYSELEKSEEKHRGMIANISDVIGIMDINGIIRYKSPNIERLFGWRPEDLVNTEGWTTVHPDDLERIQKEFFTVLDKDNSTKTVQYRYKCRNGSYKLIELTATNLINDSNINGVLMNYRDITERKQLELRFQQLAETSTDWIWEFDENNIFTYSSSGVTQLLGYTPEEIIGKSAFDLIPSPEKEMVEKEFAKSKNYHEPFTNLQNINQHKDGHLVTIESSGSPLFNSDGKFKGYRGIDRDISERKRMEEELHQAHKMESIGTISGGIAHDFNNILGIIIGNTELAMDDVPEWNHAYNNLKEIKTAGMRATEIIKQLLSFSRKTEQIKQNIRLLPIIKESIKLIRSSIPTTIEIQLEVKSTEGIIEADPTQIHQILINLCTNASHAMEENGGTLTISLSEIELDSISRNQFENLEPGVYVQLTINDTGVGIDNAIIDKVYDPYFTTKEIGKGSGMGLAVVHGIVKSNNGSISVYSEPGHGTSFKILFPSADKEFIKEDKSINIVLTGNENILFVDDEDALAKMGAQMLERLGYKVVSETNPAKALEMIEADPFRFDLIITDMTMPHLTGDQLTKKILKVNPEIPVVLCTGFSNKIDRERALKMGIRYYLDKPLNKIELATVVREVLSKSKSKTN